jgi:hypothetical protein
MPKANASKTATAASNAASEQAQTLAQSAAPAAAETVSVGGKTIATGAVVEHGSPEATPHNTEIVTIQETTHALVIPKGTSVEAWTAIGHRIGEAMEGASWRIGDWLNFGLNVLGFKDYENAVEATKLSEQYLRVCSSVSQRVAPELRHSGSIERFRLLLAMPVENVVIPEDQRKGSASRAETLAEKITRFEGWTMGELRAKTKRQALPPTPPPADPATGNDHTAASEAAANTEAGQSGSTTGDTAPPTTPPAGRPSMTAEGIYNMAKVLTIGLEELTPERITLLATFEEKEGRLKPLAALLKIAIQQVGSTK